MKTNNIVLTLLVSATLAACAGYDTRPGAPAKVSDGMLTGNNGMTLYIFDKDTAGSGKSVCVDACATNWPPLFAMDSDSSSGDYSIVTRNDGKKQWAFKGKPLYFWAKDQKAGDKTGDGVNKVWHIAQP